MRSHLEVFGLLPELEDVFAVQFSLSAVIVLDLVLQLSLVLQADQIHAQLLQRFQLPVLQLLSGLVMSDQHGVLHLLLRLLFIKLLEKHQRGKMVFVTVTTLRVSNPPTVYRILFFAPSYLS